MSWAEIKKALNDDLNLPLNKAIGEIYDGNGDRCYIEYETGEYKVGLALPYDFSYASAVVYNNEIHLLGSQVNNMYTKHYKWNGSSWASVSTLPYNFYEGSAVVYNNEIHILGGSGGRTKHYKWNGTSWTSVSTLPYNSEKSSAVVYNNEIHILGSDYNSSTYKYHYKWNGSSWTSVSTLPYNFYRGAAVVYNNEIHILGSIGGTNKHYKWNGSSWDSVSTLPYDQFYSGSAVVYNNEIHILGTQDGSSGNRTKHYKWNGSSWSSVSTLPYDFYYGSAVVHNNEIHILGGDTTYSQNHYKWNGSSWQNYAVYPKIENAYIHVNGNKMPTADKGRIKSVQRGKASAATITISNVDPSKCIVILDPATNGSTAVAVSHTLTENTLTLSGLANMGWQVIEFN